MIGKDSLLEVKQALYNNCKDTKFCCICLEGNKHIGEPHCFHRGSLKIGHLETLHRIIDTVINDTSPQHFRILQVCHYLETNDYIRFDDGFNDASMFGIVTFYCTEKLWNEQSALYDLKNTNIESDIKKDIDNIAKDKEWF